MNEPAHKKPGLLRKLSYILLLVVALLFVTESILSIVYFQKYGGSPLAVIALFKRFQFSNHQKEVSNDQYKNQQLARPDSSAAVNQQIADETQQANGFVYEPWILYKSVPFNGTYIHTDGFIRKTVPDVISGDTSTPIIIYFFGGSTTFGFHVADDETIPSQFVQLLQQKTKKPVRVVNYGIPTYYSYHELMLFTQLLYQNHQPQIAIFTDGLNDFIGIQSTLHKKSFLDYRVAQSFSMDIRRGNPTFEDSLEYVFQLPAGASVTHLSDSLFGNYTSTVSSIEKTAGAFQVKPFFFVQPVPFYKYPNQAKDPVCSKKEFPQYQSIYPRLEQWVTGSNNKFFLGNMLEHETGIPFIDGFHYAPLMNKKLAAEMVRVLLPVIESTTSD